MKILLGVMLLSCACIDAQIDERLNFYPLHVGDLWQYEITYLTEYGLEEVSYFEKKVLADTILQNSLKYFIVEQPPFTYQKIAKFDTIYVRIDTLSGRLLRYDIKKKYEIQLDSFFAEPENMINVEIIDYGEKVPVIIYEEIQLPVFNLGNTRIRNIQSLTMSGAGFYMYFAYNIGLFYQRNYSSIVTAYGNTYKLVYARIAEKEYGTFVSVNTYSELPNSFFLEQNYPNPFNSSTRIRFGVNQQAKVNLQIFDMLGSEIKTLVDESLQPGVYEKIFDGKDLVTGIYLYRLTSGNYFQTKKFVLVK